MIEIRESEFYWQTPCSDIFLGDEEENAEIFEQLYAQMMGWA